MKCHDPRFVSLAGLRVLMTSNAPAITGIAVSGPSFPAEFGGSRAVPKPGKSVPLSLLRRDASAQRTPASRRVKAAL